MKLKGGIITLAICGGIALQAWSIYSSTEQQSEIDAARARVASLESELAHLEARARAEKQEARARAEEQEARARSVEKEVRAWRELAAAPRNEALSALAESSLAEEKHEGEAPPPPPPAPPIEEKLDQAFAEEVVDPDWAEPAANHVVDAFSVSLPQGSSIRDVDCRSSLCRMEIIHRAGEGHDELMRAFMEQPTLWSGPASFSRATESTGEQITLIFLGRPGSDSTGTSLWY